MRGVPRKGKKAHADFTVRLGEDELGRIFHLRDSLEQSESLIQNAERYREMDRVLEAQGEGAATLDLEKRGHKTRRRNCSPGIKFTGSSPLTRKSSARY